MTSDWALRRKQQLIEQILRLLNLAGQHEAHAVDRRDHSVAERDHSVAERDDSVAERDDSIAERDDSIAERDDSIGDDSDLDLEVDASACSRGATPLTRYSYYDNEGSGYCTDFPRWR